MKRESDRLERLFSRALDGEGTPAERDLLERLFRADVRIRSDFEAYRVLDDEVGGALRAAIGRSPRVVRMPVAWRRVGRGLLVAAAACIAGLAWLQPQQPAPKAGERRPAQAGLARGAGSWFVPAEQVVDVVKPAPRSFERPELKVRGTQREWIVVPGDRPGSFYVIEVDRVRTHVIRVHQDF
jgi:hypothetical protein